ncbi:MAG: class I SAM-dependent methyltransferase [Candidatus Binatia bacterium]
MRQVAYEDEAERYAAARGLALDAIAPWREAIAPWLARAAPILDGGAGTGQFTNAFRAWFDCDVVALEPAAAMRRTACTLAAGDPRQRWVGGRLEELPLARATCGAAWLSTVVHHVRDLPRCADELRRVLVPGAPVLIRGAFPGRHEGITLLRFFPETMRRLETFPGVDEVCARFADAGFTRVALHEVAQRSAASLTDYRARVVTGRHADSLLAVLDDGEFARGLARLDDAIAGGPPDAAVHDRLTLLVLR